MAKAHLRLSDYLPGKFPIAVTKMMPQTSQGIHDHEFLELVVIISGQGEHYTADESHRVSAGDIFVIHPGIAHGYRDTQKLGLWNVLINKQWFDNLTGNINRSPGFYAFFELEPQYRKYHRFKSRLSLSSRQLERLNPLLEKLRRYSSPQHSDNMSSAGVLLEIVGFLANQYKSDLPQSAALLKFGSVVRYIETNYYQPITLEELADQAAVSSRSLLRLFRHLTGTTPIDYLLNHRITQAARMLLESDETITAIAFKCGFSDSNYFCRQFKKIRGITPRNFRHANNQ